MRLAHRSLLCLLLACSFASPAFPQSRSAVADSLKKVIADQRLRVHYADSTGDAKAAIDLRIRLAIMLKPKEAVKLMREAVMVADSMGLLDEGYGAREELAMQLFRAGDRRGAYEQLREVAQGRAELMNDRDLEHALVLQRASERWQAERDSMDLAWTERLKAADDRTAHAEANAERWMWTTTGVGALCLILLTIFLYRSNLAARRMRTEIDGLREEITALRVVPKNRVREEPNETRAPSDPAPTAVVPEAKAPALDEQVLGFFRKKAPERLSTLREARARGDNDKVVRVVHSLRPQLTAMDAQLGELCTAIMSKEAVNDPQHWNMDLDRLEAAVERWLH